MADFVRFKSGLVSSIENTGLDAGQLLFAIKGKIDDEYTGSIYFDKDSNTRVKLNADAYKLAKARSISLAGGVTGSVEFDGSTGVTIQTTVTDNSHKHTIANITGLQTALDDKMPKFDDAGSETVPVYFLDGVPVACTSISLNANTASKWKDARIISISSTAGKTGTSIDGSTNQSLILPQTLTNFTSITSATFIGNLTGTADSAKEADHATSADSADTANTAGHATTASSLTSGNTINGTTFTGASPITTSYWGTARNIYIQDSDGSNTGAAVSVNGGANATLKLPATIKATLSGNAATATALTSSAGSANRPVYFSSGKPVAVSDNSVITNLESTTGASIYAAAPRPGITGTLGPANGGTGKTTLKNACNALLNALGTDSSTPADADYYISQYVNGGTTTTTYHRRPMSALWSYIAGKGDGRYLKLSGGTMTGLITGQTKNGTWISITRNGAFRTETAPSNTAANAVISMKTSSGAWAIGNTAGSDNLYFVFGTDTNYSAGTNTTYNYYINTSGLYSGTASKANTLATARTINGTSFNGSANITTANWGTARDITIGGAKKSVNGSGNVSWSLNEIGANSLDGSTHFISLTGGDKNTTGYRLIGQSSIIAWANKRISFIVASRHSGNGLVTINYGCNNSTVSAANCYCNIRYFGISKGDVNGAISSDSFCAYVSSDGATMYFFWKYNDYNTTYITVLKNFDAFTFSSGTWMTSIGSTYGTAIATTCINMADSVFDSGNDTTITFNYSAAGLSSTDWFAAWNGYELRAISSTNTRTTIGAMAAISANGYYGMGTPAGATNVWIRTTTQGIIPYQSGGSGNIGTESWPFSNIWGKHINVINSYYPSVCLVCTSANSASTYTKAYIEGNYGDQVNLWVDSDKTTTAKSRRAISLQGFAATSNVANSLKICQCNTAGTWLSDLLIYHQGNIVYSATEPTNPITGMIWLQPV